MNITEGDHHQFIISPILGKHYCVKCGLIRLNNAFTDWAVSKGCNYQDDPGLARQRKKTSHFG